MVYSCWLIGGWSVYLFIICGRFDIMNMRSFNIVIKLVFVNVKFVVFVLFVGVLFEIVLVFVVSLFVDVSVGKCKNICIFLCFCVGFLSFLCYVVV